jgi:cupin-like protein
MAHGSNRPTVVEAADWIGELLPAFDQDYLRRSFQADAMTLVLGVRRARQMFPRSSRFNSSALVDWEASTKVTLLASEAFDVIFDPELDALMPYAVLPVQLFGRPLRSVIVEMQRRLGLDDDGFALLWIGSGGHVTPLHHDGPMVHHRWHLLVRGHKRFDLLPPRFPGVSRLPPWDLYRRFSTLYKSPLPDAWFTDRAGTRVELEPGQMVTWDRRWWHRVEIDRRGVTIALSTRGMRDQQQRSWRGLANQVAMHLVGDVENIVESRAPIPEIVSLDDVRAMRDAG